MPLKDPVPSSNNENWRWEITNFAEIRTKIAAQALLMRNMNLGCEKRNSADGTYDYRHIRKEEFVHYAWVLDGVPKVFVKSKAFREDLRDRTWITKVLKSAYNCNVETVVLTNGAEWRVYKVSGPTLSKAKFLFKFNAVTDPTEQISEKLARIIREGMALGKNSPEQGRVELVDFRGQR
ncbi:hypothetical protein [Tranquillimonas alkanivorans]|uniref:Type I restriction enzyme R protein N-terminal domain-containing protein n=1 Tax=Tranquillimonas alkanivorans TaxID=441119 RepID=A0A1I5VTZ6_9RHOB|nr:hypothetical protein [Tranquillimonas alkanivorans]SFQ10446.1 hypothetical protein SAMN04488047_13513 [Tranquillimonas alkanivorans]